MHEAVLETSLSKGKSIPLPCPLRAYYHGSAGRRSYQEATIARTSRQPLKYWSDFGEAMPNTYQQKAH